MNQSENIQDLVAALAKAQAKMQPAKFNKKNPHFKSKYADFTSCMEVCRIPLSENGLAVMQYCETHQDKLMLVTMLAHTSGQWIKSLFPLTAGNATSQQIGAAMTYGKRYSLSAMLGIVSDEEDDDGEGERIANEATKVDKSYGNSGSVVQPPAQQITKISNDQLDQIDKLKMKVDKPNLTSIAEWMKTSLKIPDVTKLEHITANQANLIIDALNRAIKDMSQQKKEQSNA